MTTPRFGRAAPTIGVKNLSRARAFYETALGFEAVFTNGDPVIFAVMERDKAEVHLLEHTAHIAMPYTMAHIMVTHIDALYKTCLEHQVNVIKPLEDKDYGQRAFVIEDSEGNRLDFGEEN